MCAYILFLISSLLEEVYLNCSSGHLNTHPKYNKLKICQTYGEGRTQHAAQRPLFEKLRSPCAEALKEAAPPADVKNVHTNKTRNCRRI